MRKNNWIVLAAFLCGICAANFMKKELLTTYGILNTYFLEQYPLQTINYDRLFCHVFLERLKAMILLFLCGKVMNERYFFFFTESILAGVFGFLLVVGIVNLGVKGIVVILSAMFPQWLFYVAAWMGYAKYRYETKYNLLGVGSNLAPVVLFVAVLFGIIMEGYINPLIMQKILKIL